MESIFQPHLTRRAGDNFWKLWDPVVLEPIEGQAEPIVCKVKPVTLFGQGTLGAGWLELRQQRSLPALELLLPMHPGREIDFVATLISLDTAFSLSN